MAANFLSDADTDGDGAVSADEFKAAAPKGPPPGGGPGGPPPTKAANDSSATQDDSSATTNPADTNGDGSVSGAELLAYLQGAANDVSSTLTTDASSMMQDLLAQLSKYSDSDTATTTAKVA